MSFPSSPSNGQIATVGGIQYQYNTTLGTWSRYVGNSPVFSASILYENNIEVVTRTSVSTGNLTISGNTISLTPVGPGATTVGSSTTIPVVTTDAYGRVAALTSAPVATTLNISGSSGTGSIGLASQTLSITGGTGITTLASGQTVTINNSGVVSASAGTGISVSGTNPLTITNTGLITASAGTGISVSGTNPLTITNTGVTSLTAGTAMSVSASTGGVTVNNTGVTSLTGGTAISVSASTGGVTVNNTGVTSVAAGTGVSVSATTGASTISIGQSVATTASPTFAGLTTTGTNTIYNAGGANYNESIRIPRANDGYVCIAMACDTSGAGSISGQFNQLVYPSSSSGLAGTGGYTIRANGTDVFGISTAGNMYGANSLYMSGDIYSSYSDINLKTVVGKIQQPLDLVRQIETFYYEPNEQAIKLGATPGRRVGVNAQSVQKVQPETVGQSPLGNEYLTVQYERLVPLLIESIKQQQDQIDFLTQEIDKLKGSN